MTLAQADVEYFNRGQWENPRYWSRLGGKPDFRDAAAVDLGCGHGSLCIEIARSGARKVIGIDLSARLIDFANENLRINYPQLTDVVEFRCQDLKEIPHTPVDHFVSKDTFEHVIGLDQVLAEMRERLKPGGRVYAGFGPLWNSPFGDHGRTKTFIPWGHLLFKESDLIHRVNRTQKNPVTSIYELGLNKMALADYRRVFDTCALKVVFLQVNVSSRLVSRIFSLPRRFPVLQEYFSHNIYCILERPRI